MNIQLHIERLVLVGLPLSRPQGTVVRTVVERELRGLLSPGQLTSQTARRNALPPMQGGAIQAAISANPAGLGAEIARAVYSSIGDRT